MKKSIPWVAVLALVALLVMAASMPKYVGRFYGDGIGVTNIQVLASNVVIGGFIASDLLPNPIVPPRQEALQLWLEPENGFRTNSSGGVVQWNDASGLAHHATATGTAAPLLVAGLNGRKAVAFDATDDLLNCGNFMAGASAITVVAVYATTDNTNNGFVLACKQGAFGSTTNEWFLWVTTSANSLSQLGWSGLNAISETAVNINGGAGYLIAAVTWTNGSHVRFWGNGYQLTQGGSGWDSQNLTNTGQPILIGYCPGYSNPGGGSLQALFLWSTNLSTQEILSIQRQLTRKYFRAQVVADGNSLSSGSSSGTTNTLYRPWPYQIGALLSNQARVSEFGIDGQHTATMTANAPTKIDPMWIGEITNIEVAWEISNEIAFGVNSSTAWSNFTNYCAGRMAAGYTVVCLPVLPRSDGGIDADFETKRADVNGWFSNYFTASGLPLGSVNFAHRIAWLPSVLIDAGSENNTALFLTDKVHVNNAGAQIVTTNVAGVLNRL